MHLLALIRQNEHFEEYIKSVIFVELSEDPDGFIFGAADGDPIADLEHWEQWYTGKTSSPWSFPVIYTQRAKKRKDTATFLHALP